MAKNIKINWGGPGNPTFTYSSHTISETDSTTLIEGSDAFKRAIEEYCHERINHALENFVEHLENNNRKSIRKLFTEWKNKYWFKS